ncbi:MAG: UbiD family decarboxylase [Haloferacaceae archaeon]
MSQQTTQSGLRSWLREVDDRGQLLELEGADWDLEMGAISEMIEQELSRESPAILFDDVPGYPEGYRTLYNHLGSVERLALAVGLPTEYDHILDFVDDFDEATSDVERLPPDVVTDGPVMENVRTGEDIDLTEVPVPKHHERDGGRYMGTAVCVITRDPDNEDWVNLGTYRAQVRDDDEIYLYISPGKHGRLHRDTYFERGEPMPVVMTFGQDPGLYFAAGTETETGVSELDYAGGIRGEPYDVIEGPETGLPIPADAEIAIEGHVHPDDRGVEGPFGEWMGYYGSGARTEPYVRVEGMYFRDDPILVCSPPHKPPQECTFMTAVVRSSLLKQELKNAGVPNVEGVWRHESGGSRLFNVVSIRQRYAGHARQAATVASQTRAGAYANRFTVVVDEDIDPSDLDEVLWAMSTRCDPATDIEIQDRTWSTPLDPLVKEEDARQPFNSRAIVDATIPYERMEEFPPVAETSPEYREEIKEKWGDQLPI